MPTKMKTPPRDVSEEVDGVEAAAEAAVAACRRLHAAVDRLDQAAADSLNITRNDLRCLNLLEQGPLAPARIATALGLTSGSVTALLDRLEARGFVARSRDPDDRRALRVSLQAVVFETVGRLYLGFAEELRAAVRRHGATEGAMLSRHLHEAAAACEAALTRGKQSPDEP